MFFYPFIFKGFMEVCCVSINNTLSIPFSDLSLKIRFLRRDSEHLRVNVYTQ